MKQKNGLPFLSVVFFVLDLTSASEGIPRLAQIVDDNNSNPQAVLCQLADKCPYFETNEAALTAVESLLRSGANPNSEYPNSNGSVLILLVSQAYHRMLENVMSLEDVDHPLDVNSEFSFEGRPFTALTFAISRLYKVDSGCHNLGSCKWCLSLSARLNNGNVNINTRSPDGLSPVELFVSQGRVVSIHIRKQPLHLFWLRPELDDEQREIVLYHQ